MCRVQTGVWAIALLGAPPKNVPDITTLVSMTKVDPSSVIIAASKEHIRRLSERLSDNAAALESIETVQLYALYHNLNAEGQKEVANLMRLMAYMDAFKKLQ